MCNHWCCYCCCNALLLLTFWLCALSYATHISRCFPFIFLRSSVPRVIHAARAQPPNPSANHCTTPPTKPPTTHRLPRCTAFMSSGYVALHAHKGRRLWGGVGLKKKGGGLPLLPSDALNLILSLINKCSYFCFTRPIPTTLMDFYARVILGNLLKSYRTGLLNSWQELNGMGKVGLKI